LVAGDAHPCAINAFITPRAERMTTRRLFQLTGWACVIAIAALSLVAPSLRPVTVLPHDLEHAAIFAITGFALGLGYPNRVQLHMSALIVFAAVIELAQLYAPGRHARVIDFVVDALSACAGVACAAVVTWMGRRTAESGP
jgi:hypothetical protein